MASSGVKSQSEAFHRGQLTTGKKNSRHRTHWCGEEKVCVQGVEVGVLDGGVESHDFWKTQTNAWREEEGKQGRRKEEEERGDGVFFFFLVGAWLLLVVVVADGGQSLAYCHSPLTGQITSEHCLAGQVQNPWQPHPPRHHLLMPVCVYAHRTGSHTHKVEMCVWVVVVVVLGGVQSEITNERHGDCMSIISLSIIFLINQIAVWFKQWWKCFQLKIVHIAPLINDTWY